MSYNNETGMYEGYIYKIWNDVNTKLYIGQTTTNIMHRWGQHISKKKNINNQAIYHAMNKYGVDKFHICEIEKVCDIDKKSLILKLNELEKSYIELYHSFISDNGYNLTLGGGNTSEYFKKPTIAYDHDGNILFKAESITAMSPFTGDKMHVIIDCCNGKTVPRSGYIYRYETDSFDTFRTKYQKPHPKKTYVFYANGDFYKEYDSIGDAADDTGVPYTRVRDSIDFHRLQYGYYFSATPVFDYEKLTGNKIGVDVYNTDGVLIGKYESISDAMRSVGLDVIVNGQSNIKKCMNGEQKIAFGYIWRYSGDAFDKYVVVPRISYMKCINVYTIDNQFVDTFISQTIAAEKLECSARSINSCLKGRQKTHKGYRFYYANDQYQPDPTKVTNITAKELLEQYVA